MTNDTMGTSAKDRTASASEQVMRIGETAGLVWRHLNAEGDSTVPRLARALGEKPDRVAMAVGWLAREDKVSLTLKRNSTQVALKTNTPTW